MWRSPTRTTVSTGLRCSGRRENFDRESLKQEFSSRQERMSFIIISGETEEVPLSWYEPILVALMDERSCSMEGF
jgi:hypothetical protein